jgi:hypothetical protein
MGASAHHVKLLADRAACTPGDVTGMAVQERLRPGFAQQCLPLHARRDPTLQGDPGVHDDYMKGVLGDAILVNGAPGPAWRWPPFGTASASSTSPTLAATSWP